MAKVTFYVQRHGAHTKGQLNDEGRRQVATSAKKHLTGIKFSHFMSSETLRAGETITVAAHAISCDFAPPIIDPGFGFSFTEALPLEKETPYKNFLEWLQEHRSQGKQAMVKDTFEHWKPSQIVAAVLHQTMRLRAQQFSSAGSDINVLVGSHATCSLATLSPDNTEGAPNNGDIAVYGWTVDNKEVTTLTTFDYLAAPTN